MSYSSGCGYSSLEKTIIGSYSGGNSNSRAYSGGSIDYMIAAEPVQEFKPMVMYDFSDVKKEVYADSYRASKRVSQTYYSSVGNFLNPQRPLTSFVGEASEVKEFVEEAFVKLTSKEFPDDVVIRIVSEEELKKMHPGNILGFAINRKHLGLVSEIFVKKDLLDRLMLTIGHELGHVITRRLANDKDEEAKAFAFSLAWMKKIKEENIANLSTAIQLDKPAKNGLHDVALDFVLDLMNRGKEAIEVWVDIVKGLARVETW